MSGSVKSFAIAGKRFWIACNTASAATSLHVSRSELDDRRRRLHLPGDFLGNSDPRTNRFNFTIWTIRIASIASTPAMPNQPMTEQSPLLLRHKVHESQF